MRDTAGGRITGGLGLLVVGFGLHLPIPCKWTIGGSDVRRRVV